MSKQMQQDKNQETSNPAVKLDYLSADNENIVISRHDFDNEQSSSYEPLLENRISINSCDTSQPISLLLNFGLDSNLALVQRINKKFSKKR